jgi:hypothetical protein
LKVSGISNQGLVKFTREEKVLAGFLIGGSLTAERVR